MSNLRKSTLKNLKNLRDHLKGKTIEDDIKGYQNPIDYKLDTYEDTAKELSDTEQKTKQLDFKEKDTRDGESTNIMDFSDFKKLSDDSKFTSPSFGDFPKSKKDDKLKKKLKKNKLEHDVDGSAMRHDLFF